MSTANLTAEDLTREVPCHDEDGKPTTITITVTADEVDGNYVISVSEDGDEIDGDVADTLAEAAEAVAQFARQITDSDRKRERDRLRNARTYGRECLMGAAAEMTGEDKDAAKLLALLVGSGRGPAALAALRRIALK